MLNFFALPSFTTVTRALLVLCLLNLRLSAAAQTPAWQSAQTIAVATAATSSNFSGVTATAVDAAGNVYLTGSFWNSVVLGNITLTSLGNRDIFVAKFNPISNQFVWAQQAGGKGSETATALEVKGTSVYVAGNFDGSTAGFGPVTLNNLGPAGTADVFVAKLIDAGSTGSFVWAQPAGGTRADLAATLAVSGTSVYVAASSDSPVVAFGAITLANRGPASTADVFVAKLTDAGSTGSFVWAQQAGGTGSDVATTLTASGTSVYVAGFFQSATANFGAVALTNGGTSYDNDVFVAKLIDVGSTGSFVWAQRAGGIGSDIPEVLAVSGTSVYVAGNFSGSTAGFGAATLTNLGSAGTRDAFVAKLTDAGSTGSFVWAQQAGGTDNDNAVALAISGANVYVAGNFGGTAAAFGSTTLLNAGTRYTADAFVARLTDAGSFVWAQRAGGTGDDFINSLVVSGSSLYMAGSFSSLTANFGSVSLTNPTPNSYTGFLASLTDATLTATTTAASPREPANLFPNPAHNTATLRLPAGTAPAPLVLSDALGRAVRRYPAPAAAEAALDLNGLPAGLYLLRGAGPAQRLVVE